MTIEIPIKRRDPEEIINILSEKLMLCMAKSKERQKALEYIASSWDTWGPLPEYARQMIQKALED